MRRLVSVVVLVPSPTSRRWPPATLNVTSPTPVMMAPASAHDPQPEVFCRSVPDAVTLTLLVQFTEDVLVGDGDATVPDAEVDTIVTDAPSVSRLVSTPSV